MRPYDRRHARARELALDTVETDPTLLVSYRIYLALLSRSGGDPEALYHTQVVNFLGREHPIWIDARNRAHAEQEVPA